MKSIKEVFVLNEIDFEDQSKSKLAKIIPHIMWPLDLDDEEMKEFEELQGDDYVKPLGKDHPTAQMAKSQGFEEKLNDSFFYHPDHWKVVQDFPDLKQDQYWYWTTTDGQVALQALTQEAKEFLTFPNTENYNTPWGRASNSEEGKKATMWLAGQIQT